MYTLHGCGVGSIYPVTSPPTPIGRSWRVALSTLLLIGTLTACQHKASERLAQDLRDQNRNQVIGVTNTEVKIGFVIVDQKQLGASVGFAVTDTGDESAQITALVDAVNRRGGLANRKIVPIIKVYNAFVDSVVNEEKLCRAFTEDEQVFAVVLNGQFQKNARPCYANAKTLMLDQTLVPYDETSVEELKPYFYQPLLMDYGKLIAALATALKSQEFLSRSTKLAVLAIDTPQNRRVVQDRLIPQLDQMDATAQDIQWIDPTSNATLQAGQNQAVLAFKSEGIDRVLIVGGSRLLPFFVSVAIPQNFMPRYAITSFDSPAFVALRTPEALQGAVGISLSPSDLNDAAVPFPSSPAERACVETLAAAGIQFAGRSNARPALAYCDLLSVLEQSFRASEDLTADGFREGLDRITDVQTATNYRVGLSSSSSFGVVGYRPITFQPSCVCFEFAEEVQVIER